MVNDRDRDDQGRYRREYSDQDFIAAVRKHDPAGTGDVADELGIAIQSADYRLRLLEEGGKLSKKKVGRSLVWSVTNEND